MSDYDEDFSVLAIENERLMAEVDRLRAALHEPIGLTCVHGVTMSNKPSRACVCHTSWIKMGEELLDDQID